MLGSFQPTLTPRLPVLAGISVPSRILVKGQTVWENAAAESEAAGIYPGVICGDLLPFQALNHIRAEDCLSYWSNSNFNSKGSGVST